MPGKLRVHELAKELGVTSKELLATLKEQGEFVKTASSTIESPVIRKMRAFYGDSADASTKQTSADAGAPKPGAATPAPQSPPIFLGRDGEPRAKLISA